MLLLVCSRAAESFRAFLVSLLPLYLLAFSSFQRAASICIIPFDMPADPDTILTVKCDRDPVVVNWRTNDEVLITSIRIYVACLTNGSTIVENVHSGGYTDDSSGTFQVDFELEGSCVFYGCVQENELQFREPHFNNVTCHRPEASQTTEAISSTPASTAQQQTTTVEEVTTTTTTAITTVPATAATTTEEVATTTEKANVQGAAGRTDVRVILAIIPTFFGILALAMLAVFFGCMKRRALNRVCLVQHLEYLEEGDEDIASDFMLSIGTMPFCSDSASMSSVLTLINPLSQAATTTATTTTASATNSIKSPCRVALTPPHRRFKLALSQVPLPLDVMSYASSARTLTAGEKLGPHHRSLSGGQLFPTTPEGHAGVTDVANATTTTMRRHSVGSSEVLSWESRLVYSDLDVMSLFSSQSNGRRFDDDRGSERRSYFKVENLEDCCVIGGRLPCYNGGNFVARGVVNSECEQDDSAIVIRDAAECGSLLGYFGDDAGSVTAVPPLRATATDDGVGGEVPNTCMGQGELAGGIGAIHPLEIASLNAGTDFNTDFNPNCCSIRAGVDNDSGFNADSQAI